MKFDDLPPYVAPSQVPATAPRTTLTEKDFCPECRWLKPWHKTGCTRQFEKEVKPPPPPHSYRAHSPMQPLEVAGVKYSTYRHCVYRKGNVGQTIQCHFSGRQRKQQDLSWTCNCGERKLTREHPVWVQVILSERTYSHMLVVTLSGGRRVGLTFAHTILERAIMTGSKTATVQREATHCRIFNLPEGLDPKVKVEDRKPGDPTPQLIIDGFVVRYYREPANKAKARIYAMTRALDLGNFSREDRTAIWEAYFEERKRIAALAAETAKRAKNAGFTLAL